MEQSRLLLAIVLSLIIFLAYQFFFAPTPPPQQPAKTAETPAATQDQLAKEAGTNQAVIQKIENGKSLRPRQIMRIAEVLNVNPAWLQFGEPWADKGRP